MHEQFFNFLGLREDPFHVSPDPRFYYSTRAHESALSELLFGIETRKGFLVLTGEAGTGKTCLLNQIIEWLHRRGRSSAYVFHAHLQPIGLLRFILHGFGVPCLSKCKSDLVSTLHTWLLQRHVVGDLPVLIVDEAQALPPQTLDELRLLLNLETPRGKLLQIILSGQPELDEKLRMPALRQLRQRIMFHSRLSLLTQKETAAYISCRLAAAGCSDSSLFPDEVVQDIYRSSRGIPRVVNLLCEHALISAYAQQQRVVAPEMIQRIALDFDLLANPLVVAESEFQPHYGRVASFRAIERPAPSSVPIQPAVKVDPVPAVAPPTAVESLEPMAPTTYASTPGRFSEIPKYWRRYRSRSAVAVLARNSVASVQRAWEAFTHRFVDYARSARIALFSVFERSALSSVPMKPAVKVDPVPAVAPPTPVESLEPVAPTTYASTPGRFSEIPKYWRRYRSRSAVAVLARNSVASVQRAWRAFTHRFVDYARSARIALFSVFERPAPSSVPMKPAVKVDPVPAVASPAPVEAPKPVAHTAYVLTPGRFGEIPKYWRRYRSHSAVAVLARNFVASVQRAWDAFIHRFVDYACSARIALFSVFERPAPSSVASRPAVNLNPVPTVAPPAPVVAPKPVARTANASTSGRFGETPNIGAGIDRVRPLLRSRAIPLRPSNVPGTLSAIRLSTMLAPFLTRSFVIAASCSALSRCPRPL